MSASTEPSATEAKFFWVILKNLKEKPDIDWDAVVAETHFKNVDVAKTRYGQIRRKMEKSENGGNGNAFTATPTKGGIAKAKGRVGSKADGPKSAKKGGKAKKKASPSEEEDVDDGEEETVDSTPLKSLKKE